MTRADALLEVARGIACRAGAGEQIEAYVAHSVDTEVKVFGGEVESLSVAEVDGVGVRVLVDGRQGYAWAGSLEPDVVADTLAEARDNAAFGAPDEWQALATPDDVAAVAAPDLDLFRDDLLTVPTDDKVTLTLELERATRAGDPRVRGVEAASYGDAAIETAVANSLGVEAVTRRTTSSCASVALAGDGAATQTGYGFSAGRTFADLDLEVAARDAVERAVRMLGATQPKSERLPVILDPLVTRSLLAILGSALSGESVLKGRSMFVDRAGEVVAAPGVTLVDDPTVADAFGASTHDSEGVPTRRTVLVDAGVLRGFLHNVYTGRRSGSGTTGSAVRGVKSTPGVGARALALTPGTRTPDEIVAGADRTLYVQSVSGLHSGTNPVSGDFSVGAEGLMVRGGALAEPVREVTIASTLPRMLQEVAEVGSDLTWLPGGAAGMTVVLGEMTLSGS
ncbi:MAG TPA: TldD/PmbA family protein [Acidimicrobiia bacterium]|nr:TldD/PmbA family protein [Acidimicrobiia bacterium]